MGETTRVENRGETTRGETTRGETSWGRNDLSPRAAPIFMDVLSLPLIQEKQPVSYWRNKMVTK